MTASLDKPVVFFTPGRTVREKPVPVFQRSRYFEHLDGYNCISCFDPTLFMNESVSLAWFQGSRKRFYALELATIWKNFVTKIGLNMGRVLYYGSSGGGIPGFFLAKNTPGSTLFMSNVQTDIRDYDPRTLKTLIQVAFEGDSKYVETASKNQNRFSINGHSGVFNLVYAQNKVDVFHFEKHYKKWRQETNLEFFRSVKFIEYNDQETGHGPLGMEAELEIIRGILEGKEYSHVFPEVNIDDAVLKISKYNENQSVVIKHGAFPDHTLNFPISWLDNPYKSKNWCHTLNSLRWTRSIDDSLKKQVILDFYNFHILKKNKNPYFNTRRGDHTIAIRIDLLMEYAGRFDKITNEKIITLLRNDVVSLLKEEVYQVNNHGLMADFAILKAIKAGFYNIDTKLDEIYSRIKSTLTKMYDSEGVCLEHSISYQEYNLLILFNIKNIIPKNSDIHEKINNILEKSRELLGFHLLECGKYIPIGDSFRLPNKEILEKIYGHKSPFKALEPYSNKQGYFITKSGYFVYRNELTHLSLISGWHSNVHKQNDELSIFLYHKGHIVFDDPGYSDCQKWEELLDFKSEKWHSNFWIENENWSDVSQDAIGSTIDVLSSFPICVLAKQRRLNDISMTREIEIRENRLYIIDRVSEAIGNQKIIRHQFLMGDVNFLIKKSVVLIKSKVDNSDISQISVEGNGEWKLESARSVTCDRRYSIVADLLVFKSRDISVKFTVTLM